MKISLGAASKINSGKVGTIYNNFTWNIKVGPTRKKIECQNSGRQFYRILQIVPQSSDIFCLQLTRLTEVRYQPKRQN